MARYRKIDVRMWLDARFVALSPAPPNAQTLWIYLLTNPDTTSIPGLFRVGEAALAEALGWPVDAFRKCFAELESRGMARADWRARLVWVPNAIRYNAPENPNVIKSWGKSWEELPECALRAEARAALKGFLEGLPEGFREAFAEAIPEGAMKGFEEGFGEPFREGYGESGAGAVAGAGTREGATTSPPAPDGAPRPRRNRSGPSPSRATELDLERADAMRASALAVDPMHAWAPDKVWRRKRDAIAEQLRLAREVDERPTEMLDTVTTRWGEVPAEKREYAEKFPARALRDDLPGHFRRLTSGVAGAPAGRTNLAHSHSGPVPYVSGDDIPAEALAALRRNARPRSPAAEVNHESA